MNFIGIDPGKNGGIALIDSESMGTVTYKMPSTEKDMAEFFISILKPSFAVLEVVHSSPGMGVVSAFTFGKGFGMLLGCLACSGITWAPVRPQAWQKEMSCMSGGDKNVTKRMAQSLFPRMKVTHQNADALLIAMYARRVWRTVS